MIKANKWALILKYWISSEAFILHIVLHYIRILCITLCLCNKVFASREIPWMQKLRIATFFMQIKWFDALIANIWDCHSLNPLNYVNLILFLKHSN